MATILVVDDNAPNRELAASLLTYKGHTVIEAGDGAEALDLVRTRAPQLVISDILMPTMDGFEFVRRLRADPALAATDVIFWTAHYHEREALSLAHACRVSRVLTKPCEPEDILACVEQTLARGIEPAPARVDAQFHDEHMRLVTDKLSAKVAELRAVNARLEALSALNVKLASERDPMTLVESICRHARDLLASRYAFVEVRRNEMDDEPYFAASGADAATMRGLPRPRIDAGALGEVLASRRPRRWSAARVDAAAIGLPPAYPAMQSALVAPIASLTAAYGWICLVDKVGMEGFDEADERMLVALGAQVGRIYENGSLNAELMRQAGALRESELRFRQLAENIREVFWLTDPAKNEILYVSPAYAEIWGRSCESLHASPRDWIDAIHPEDRERVLIAAQTLQASGEYVEEFRIIRPDGTMRWIRDRAFPVTREDGTVHRIAGLAQDVTEWLRLERQLRQSEAALLRAQSMALLAHVITLPDGSFETWSDSLARLVAMDPATMPKSTRAWMQIVDPADRGRFRDTSIRAARTGVRQDIEYRVRRGDGEWVYVRQSMEPLGKGEEAHKRWFSTLQDITDARHGADALREREQEVRRLNADLERRVLERTAELEAANKELEAFDYSISHDLRGPLNRIDGFVAALREDYAAALDSRAQGYLDRIGASTGRMSQLIQDLLALSTVMRSELRRAEVDVGEHASAVLEALRRAEPAREVEAHVGARLLAKADPGLLRIVLENLIGNAWKFTSRTAKARIEVGMTPRGGADVFWVRDNGAGFESADAARLFTPFRRLHKSEEFSGTGIGLATVLRIVRRHGGRVWAEGAPGAGATFHFTLAPEAARTSRAGE